MAAGQDQNHCFSEEQLAAYVGGGCQEQAVEAHLTRCERCSRRVRQMLSDANWLRKQPGFGDRRADAAGTDEPDSPTGTSDEALPTIEGYQILRTLGQGAQGRVYQAIQRSTDQMVAIKIPREWRFFTTEERGRFEYEYKCAARLRHDNIITIFDSDITEDGDKYYVMDYIPGANLREHVLGKTESLTLNRALELFASVCEAVQHAHQHGVIHRDLKPSNVIVDQHGHPKVLDFGLARALPIAPRNRGADESSERIPNVFADHVDPRIRPRHSGEGMSTIVRAPGSSDRRIEGTLAYMSPEQAYGNLDEINTRTDVYSLGVMLYELLTGVYPYSLEEMDVEQILHTIQHAAPAPPSRRWTWNRGIHAEGGPRSPAAVCPIDYELDAILLKTLSKKRSRRYQSAGELAADIRHYLAAEPLDALREDRGYMLRKMLHRYRYAVGVASAFVLVIVASLLVTISFWQRSEIETREKQQSLETVDALMSHALEKVGEAKTDEALRWLRTYLQIVNAAPDRTAFHGVRSKLEQFKGRVRGKLEDALATNRLDDLVHALASDADLIAVIEELEHQPEAPLFIRQLIDRLTGSIMAPPPLGRGQATLEMIELLEILDPGNSTADDARRRLTPTASPNLAPTLQSDQTAQSGAWRINGPHQYDAAGRLQLTSSPSDTASCAFYFTPSGSITIARLTLSAVESGPPPNDTRNLLGVDLRDDSAALCGWSVQNRRQRVNDGGKETPRLEFEYGRDYEIELRHFADRNTCDVLVNGQFLVEEAPGAADNKPVRLNIGATSGAVITLKECHVFSPNVPIKRSIGSLTPVFRDHGMHLRPVVLLPDVHNVYAALDVDRDGSAEILAVELAERGDPIQLRVFSLTNELFAVASSDALTIPVGTSVVHRIASIDGVLAVAVSDEPNVGGEVADPESLSIEFKGNSISTWVIHRTFAKDLERFRFGPEQEYLAIGLGGASGSRGLELFDLVHSDTTIRFAARGFETLVPEDDAPNDVSSMLACSHNNGVADWLIVGWSNWNGWGPAVVDLAAAPLRARRLTDPNRPLGVTHAVLVDDQGDEYLVSASESTMMDGGIWTVAPGLRVWRIADLRSAPADKPLWETVAPIWTDNSREVSGIATGQIGGRAVFASTVRPRYQPGITEPLDKVGLVVHGWNTGQVELLWETEFLDRTTTPDRTLLADLNGDGDDELLVFIPRHGLLVFSEER